MDLSSRLRSRPRLILASVLFLPQLLWCMGADWTLCFTESMVYTVPLVLGLGAALVPKPRAVQAIGFGLLLMNPSSDALMTVVLGSTTPYDRTGVEVFGVLGFSLGVAFLGGHWINRRLEAFELGQAAGPMSTRALFLVVLLLCAPSVLGALGRLVLQVSYPNGRIPADTVWGGTMIWVMLVSVPAVLVGIGLLVLAAPFGVHLVRTRGVSSVVGRVTIGLAILALVSAAYGMRWP